MNIGYVLCNQLPSISSGFDLANYTLAVTVLSLDNRSTTARLRKHEDRRKHFCI